MIGLLTKNTTTEAYYSVNKNTLLEIEEFFGIPWFPGVKPKIIIVNSKNEYDELWGYKHSDWEVGQVDGTTIYLLSPEAIIKESCHSYTKEFYISLIKHEMMHVYTTFLSMFMFNPRWLFEGIAVYFSNQISNYKEIITVETLLTQVNNLDSGYYNMAGLFVKKLDDNYGREKLAELIQRTKEGQDTKSFNNLFSDVYGVDITKI